jgi:hypothetical protein
VWLASCEPDNSSFLHGRLFLAYVRPVHVRTGHW